MKFHCIVEDENMKTADRLLQKDPPFYNIKKKEFTPVVTFIIKIILIFNFPKNYTSL